MRALFNQCPHCGSVDFPILSSDTIELNIKQDGPYVEEALERLADYLRKSLEVGIKAIVLIHRYGSSGEGGRIKWAIHDALENNRYSDRVDEYHVGEDVAYGSAVYYTLLKDVLV
ncbi:Smr/MutS family protein [Polynucleobacter necessarius]|uniref:Smr/MutS family protein n=1 Tax=Polynucleobacter necessarius TaxID=576610 RepID=UPI001E53389F|nr:Smr/MutS family protein [Polynucleobacter necessarius]